MLIDESHNLRNREGRRYKAIARLHPQLRRQGHPALGHAVQQDQADLSSQLRLFIDEKANIGIRPEHFMRKHGMSETEFERKHQCQVNSILAIEKSDEFDDWRELMRLYLVRRTRSFIIQHYTEADKQGRQLSAWQGRREALLPGAQTTALKFTVDEADPADRYARLYSAAVVDPSTRCMCRATAWATMWTRRPRKAPRRPNASSSRTWGVRASG